MITADRHGHSLTRAVAGLFCDRVSQYVVRKNLARVLGFEPPFTRSKFSDKVP